MTFLQNHKRFMRCDGCMRGYMRFSLSKLLGFFGGKAMDHCCFEKANLHAIDTAI